MSIITAATPILFVAVIKAVGAGNCLINAIKEGVTTSNDMNISFDESAMKKIYSQDFQTAIVDKNTLVKTLQEHGMPHIYEQGDDVIAEIDDLKLEFKKQNDEPYLLKVSCTSENKIKGSFEKAVSELTENLQEEYTANVQDISYNKIKERLAQKNLSIDSEEILDDDSIVLTINLE